MMTIQSYLTAMLIYWVVAVIGVVLMRRLWFAKPLTLFKRRDTRAHRGRFVGPRVYGLRGSVHGACVDYRRVQYAI